MFSRVNTLATKNLPLFLVNMEIHFFELKETEKKRKNVQARVLIVCYDICRRLLMNWHFFS